MEKINPDDINDIEQSNISKIILKDGKTITIDENVPSKKNKRNKVRNTNSIKNKNYQISQRLINLTIINKKEKGTNNLNIIICKNINLSYNNNNKEINNNKDNKDINKEKKDILKNKKNDFFKEENKNHKVNDFFFDNFNYNDFWKNNLEEKEIERIITIENDFESNNDYKTIINEFESKNKNKIISYNKLYNIKTLLKANRRKKEDYKFDLTDHFNSLVDNFRKRKKEIKGNKYNKKYYSNIYNGDYNINKYQNKYNFLNKNPFNDYHINLLIIKENYNAKSDKFMRSSCNEKEKCIYKRNNNLDIIKEKLFKKTSSFDPKYFKDINFGNQIILPSNKIV